MTRILGIDPGLVHTGWAVLDKQGAQHKYVASGVILPPTKEELAYRLDFIFCAVQKICSEFNPDECSIEIIFVNNNPKTTLLLGHARAASVIAASNKKIPIFEYEPNKIKKAISGAGHASKDQIYKMLQILLPAAKPKTEDEADAIAIALAHANTSRLKF